MTARHLRRFCRTGRRRRRPSSTRPTTACASAPAPPTGWSRWRARSPTSTAPRCITRRAPQREPQLPGQGRRAWLAERPVGARAMCVWLGTLASWRPGLIGRLVREYRTMADAGAAPAVRDRRVRRRGGLAPRPDGRATQADGGTAAERASDAARFAAVLREGPAACLRRAERRPPGDLVVAWSEALYPDQLRDLGDPPLCLFVRGGADRRRPQGAPVGDRRRAAGGRGRVRGRRRRTARTWPACIGGGLARAGLVVVERAGPGHRRRRSDGRRRRRRRPGAGRAASRPVPATVAVLGCGADVVYPRRNARLYARIAGSGLVLSEFAWGVPRAGAGASRPATA